MNKDIYYAVTLPWRTESFLGFMSQPQVDLVITDNKTGEVIEANGYIFSIGLIFFRIDIVL